MHKPRPILFLLTQGDWQLMLCPAARKPSRPSRTASQSTSIRCHCIGVVSRRRFSRPCHFAFSSMEHWSLAHTGCHPPIIDRCNLRKTDLLEQKLKAMPCKTKPGHSKVSTALGIRHSVFRVEIFHAHLHLCVCFSVQARWCYDAKSPQHVRKLNERVQSTSTASVSVLQAIQELQRYVVPWPMTGKGHERLSWCKTK